jgi:hypothetical protein
LAFLIEGNIIIMRSFKNILTHGICKCNVTQIYWYNAQLLALKIISKLLVNSL